MRIIFHTFEQETLVRTSQKRLPVLSRYNRDPKWPPPAAKVITDSLPLAACGRNARFARGAAARGRLKKKEKHNTERRQTSKILRGKRKRTAILRGQNEEHIIERIEKEISSPTHHEWS